MERAWTIHLSDLEPSLNSSFVSCPSSFYNNNVHPLLPA